MRKILLPALLFISLVTYSQDTSQTKIGRIDLKVGTVIKKEYVKIYTWLPKNFRTVYDGVTIHILNITDALSKTKISGIRIMNSVRYSSFVDLEEIPGLLRFIEMLDTLNLTKPGTQTEYTFNSKDLVVYGYFGEDPLMKLGFIWNYGIISDKHVSASNRSLDLKVLDEMKEAILNSRNKFFVPFPD